MKKVFLTLLLGLFFTANAVNSLETGLALGPDCGQAATDLAETDDVYDESWQYWHSRCVEMYY